MIDPRIQRIFEAVVGISEPDRTDAVRRLCEGDAALESRVLDLLRSADRASIEGFLGHDPFGGIAPKAATPGSDAASIARTPLPERIGPYRIIGLLGEGGFGTVFHAEQREPVRREVALKVIKAGMDSAQVIARFEAERQALAIMEHANIARVYDAGTTDPSMGSRPYFAMELVAGEPITAYCDRKAMSTAQRLALFLQVCSAVQHAHTKGVIHRDIKPSNVLVSTSDGGEPIAKVIDFGVAKALHQRLSDATLFTARGQLIGTPEYMSPEQAEAGPLDVDTRSDVYSLGVLLYELLVGVRPFDLSRAALNQVAKIIRDQEPARPSSRLTSLGQAAEPIARRRHTSVSTLAKALARELEWVPLKALRKAPADRYQSAAALAADIENYLSGRPLIAGPPTVSYRVRKFVRRNRATVAVAAALVLAMIVGVGGLAAGLRQARAAETEQRRLASANAALAEREARSAAEARRERDLAQSFRRFIASDVFGTVAPQIAAGREVTVRESLNEATDRLLADASWSDVQVVLANDMARLHVEIGDTVRAAALLERAIPALDATLGPHSFERARAEYHLASLLAIKQDWWGGIAHADRAVELLVGDEPDTVAARAEAMRVAAFFDFHVRGLPEARLRLETATRTFEPIADLYPSDFVLTLALLSQIQTLSGDHDNALRNLDHAEAMLDKLPAIHASAILLTRAEYESSARADHHAAARYIERAGELTRRLLGDHHATRIPELEALANAYKRIGDRERYIAALREGAAVVHANPTHRTADAAASLLSYASALIADGRFAEAEPHAREGYARLSEHDRGWFRRTAGFVLFRCLAGLARYEEAEALGLELLSYPDGDGPPDRAEIAWFVLRMYDAWEAEMPGIAADKAAALRASLDDSNRQSQDPIPPPDNTHTDDPTHDDPPTSPP